MRRFFSILICFTSLLSLSQLLYAQQNPTAQQGQITATQTDSETSETSETSEGVANTADLSATTLTPLPTTPPLTPSADTEQLIEEDGVRVSVLGYHEFSSTKAATEMCIPTDTFRTQMQAIKDLGLPVISLADFLAWRRGEKSIANRSILITIDDGWKSVYTEAFPILKEFGYPFTVYLYKNYVDGGGKALTSEMIREMIEHGCTIGSHSVSHPFPSTIKKQQSQGRETYTSFLREELGTSKEFLEKRFQQTVSTYAYPGGFHTEEMYPLAEELGYDHLFTVTPGKVLLTSPMEALPRYIILGTHDSIFEYATTFSSNKLGQQVHITAHKTAHPVSPEPGESIDSRLPLISADLSGVADIDPSSLVMRIAGLGKVPHQYNAESKQVQFQINRRIRTATCSVSLQWRIKGQKDYKMPMRWTFAIHRTTAYLPVTEPTLPKAPNPISNHP